MSSECSILVWSSDSTHQEIICQVDLTGIPSNDQGMNPYNQANHVLSRILALSSAQKWRDAKISSAYQGLQVSCSEQ